jgi:hypothetical protein
MVKRREKVYVLILFLFYSMVSFTMLVLITIRCIFVGDDHAKAKREDLPILRLRSSIRH